MIDSTFNQQAKEQAEMEISIAQSKVQHIMNCPTVSETTEDGVENLPPEMKFKFKCDKCGMDYPMKHGLSIHKARWCKCRLNARKPSRKGTVAEKTIKRRKIKIKQDELQNVYTFTYLGTEISGDWK